VATSTIVTDHSRAADPDASNDVAATTTLVEPTLAAGAYALRATCTRTAVRVTWRAADAQDVVGFNVYRGRARLLRRLNRRIIAFTQAGRYSYVGVRPARGDRYWIQVVHLDGSRAWQGPLRPRC
jgi:hypothetical protein